MLIRSQQPLDDTSFEPDSPNLTTNASDVASLDTELVSDFSRSLANRVALEIELLFYRQQVMTPTGDLDQISIIVSFLIHTWFLVVTNRDLLDRNYADYLEISDCQR